MTAGVNDTIATAEPSLLNGNNVFVFGDRLDTNDVDVYAITVPNNARIRAETVEGDRASETCESEGVDTRLTLFDQNGVQLANDDDGGRGFCSRIDGTGVTPVHTAARNTSGSTQTYFLMVRRSEFTETVPGGHLFVYRLQVQLR